MPVEQKCDFAAEAQRHRFFLIINLLRSASLPLRGEKCFFGRSPGYFDDFSGSRPAVMEMFTDLPTLSATMDGMAMS